LLGSKCEFLSVRSVADALSAPAIRAWPSAEPDRDRVTTNQGETVLVLDMELASNPGEVPLQEWLEGVPTQPGLAGLVEGSQTVSRVIVALFELRVVLPQNAVLHHGLGDVSADDAKILALELLGSAPAADSDDLLDADVEEVLQELVQCMIRVATANDER
jgi:hypothetical protein